VYGNTPMGGAPADRIYHSRAFARQQVILKPGAAGLKNLAVSGRLNPSIRISKWSVEGERRI